MQLGCVAGIRFATRVLLQEVMGGVVSVYRNYIDRYLACGEQEYRVEEEDRNLLLQLGNRNGFTKGYLKQKNGPDMITFTKSCHEKRDVKVFVDAGKERIDGSIVVKRDVPMELSVSFRGVRLAVAGDVPTKAKTRPVTEEALREQLHKTGGTPFAFGSLSVDLEEGVFVPVASLNELRRRAMERLEEAWAAKFRRVAGAGVRPDDGCRCRRAAGAQATFSASAETREQLALLVAHPMISVIYLDAGAFAREEIAGVLREARQKAKEQDKQVHVILPAVFRQHTAEFYASVLPGLRGDGFLVKSYDALGFLLEHGVHPDRIRLDHNMYAWSQESRRAFGSFGVWKDTVPLELNRGEIRRRENGGSEMVIYGYLPLMTSAQCVRKNVSACDKTQEVCDLKDRYHISFPVKNYCGECYNVIYNSRPLCLFPVFGELLPCGVGSFRLAFTVETPGQTRNVLEGLTDACGGAMDDRWGAHAAQQNHFTYGHYRRGVE